MENAEEIRSPLATQNPNIMANHFGSKMQSKLRPPSAIKRPRDFSFTSGSTEEISKPKLRRSTSQLSLKEQSKSSKANTQQRSVSSALRRQTSAGALRGNTVVNSARQGLSASRVAPRPPKSASTGRNTGPISRTNTTKSKTLVSGSTASVTKVGGKKREKWDYKGRLEDMEVRYMETSKNMSQMTGIIDENRSRLELLERINQQLEGTVQVKNQQTEEASAKIQDLKTQIHVLEDEIKSLQMKHEFELEVQERAKKSLQQENESLEMEYKIAKEEIASMKMTVAKMTADSLGITTELQATKVNLEKTVSDNRIKDETISRLEATIRENKEAIADLEGKLRQEESVRRTLHNTIQELKGNIRVFCRIRPVLAEETSEPLTVFSFGNDDRMLSIEQSSPGESVTGIKKAATKYDFQFDKVFQPSATQEIVFEEISQLVQSALDGYNVCIFAYGQTGSGKTYTMEGNIRDDHKKGMISRALEQVFHSANGLLDKGWQYEMEASFLEIYNETLRDLLGSGDTNLKHEIKLVNGSNATGNANEVMVTNIKTVGVTSEDQVYSLLEKASQNRAVAATHCNERSSRSHSVFRLKITGQNKLTDENCQGTLNLIDLAGSERLNNSCSTGERLKETKNINKSLSNLGNVIMALANKEQHIPYRNSKLTYLLQNSLGGNSKSLMFVNISPREESFQESLCSLRFATKVNQCNIGTAQKKVSHK